MGQLLGRLGARDAIEAKLGLLGRGQAHHAYSGQVGLPFH